MVPSVVQEALDKIERAHDVSIIAAHDVGSHAWNFASPDSDYDVGFIYVQPPTAYATLDEYRPSIDVQHSGADCTGWNATRFGELLVDSNPSTLEFLHSPCTYRAHEALASLTADVGTEFEPIRLYHHYRSLAATQYRTYIRRRLLDGDDPVYVIEDETDEAYLVHPIDTHATTEARSRKDLEPQRLDKPVQYREATTDRTVARNLYIIRAALYARYVRDTHEFPALDFPSFLDHAAETDRFAPETIEAARTLVARKRRGEGDAVVGAPFDPETIVLPDYIDPETHAVRGIDTQRVNAFIRTVVST